MLARFDASNRAVARRFLGREALFLEPPPGPDAPYWRFPELPRDALLDDWVAPVIRALLGWRDQPAVGRADEAGPVPAPRARPWPARPRCLGGRICYPGPAPSPECPSFRMSDGSLRPSMKLLFVILAHDRPAEVAELARTLVAAGSDARALIHFDARAEARAFDGARGGGGGRAADRPRRAPRRLPLGRLRPGRGAAQRARPGRGRGPSSPTT